MSLKKTIAVVTGANRGIGKSLVRELLGQGAVKVYAAARDIASLKEVVALDPSRVVAVQLDVTRGADIAALAGAVPDANLLINNAGALDFGTALDASEAALERNFSVNVFGTLAATRALVPVIEAQGGGAIVNVLSVVSFASMPGIAVYNASKAALWSLTQSLRGSLASRNIRVHGVFPGPVDTDMAAGLDAPKTSPDDVARAIIDGVLSGQEDIFPDPMSKQVYAAWRADHKAVEKQFAAM
jgi:NAD(P)-dependent dehydrogenase (short-subunit alcohol dehydrogenase family)